MRVRSRIKVLAALGVTMALTSACLSSGSDSSSGDKSKPEGEVKGSTVTIWASMDKPVIDGLKAGLAPLAQAAGVTVNWQKVDNINQVIMTKIQANDVPDIAMIPQPGVVADIANRSKATRARRHPGHERAQVEHAPGHARGGHRQRQALRPARQRQHQELRLLPEEGVGRRRIQGADDHRRAQRADRQDQGRRHARRGASASGPTRRPAGRRRTGSRTSSCATAAPTATTVGHARDAVRLPAGAPGRRGVREDRVHRRATCWVAASRSRATPFGTAGNPMFDDQARLHAATSRAASSPRSSRRTCRRTWTTRSACSASRRRRRAARTRCSVVATWRSC